MMLCDRSIREAHQLGEIGIEPYRPDRLQPCSYDLSLGSHFAVIPKSNNAIDPRRPQHVNKVITTEYRLLPGAFALATTREWVSLGAQMAARVEGKSSLARLGLLVHTAGFVDAGFHGTLTLEITNLAPAPILLLANMPIAQLCFFRLDRPAETPYAGKYQDQAGATASRYHQNFAVV